MIAEHVMEFMENEMRRHLNYAAERIRLGYYDDAWEPFAVAQSCREALAIMRDHNVTESSTPEGHNYDEN